MKQTFTITIYTENRSGLFIRIAGIFARRRVYIETLNVAASEVEGIHRFTIVINETVEVTRKIVQQIDKQVDVFKTFFHTDEEIEYREHMLYKVDGSCMNEVAGNALTAYNAREISAGNGNAVYEVTGSAETMAAVTKLLQPLGITDIVKSAGIAIMKSTHPIHEKLKQL